MIDEKKKAKAEKLARKGRVDEAVRMYHEAGYLCDAARLLEKVGRLKEAAATFEQAGECHWAVRCLLQGGLEDEAMQVKLNTKDWPKNFSELSESVQEALAHPDSKVWREYVEKLDSRGERARALRCLLKVRYQLLETDWSNLIRHFCDKARTKEDLELWAELALADAEEEYELNKGHGPQSWEAALAYFKSGNDEKAFELFRHKVVFMDINRDIDKDKVRYWWAPIGEDRPADSPEEILRFLEFAARKCLASEAEVSLEVLHMLSWFSFHKQGKTYKLWPTLCQDVQKEMMKRLLYWDNIEFDKSEEWTSIQRYRTRQTAGIRLAWSLYEESGRKDEDIENATITYAENIERYDYVLFSLEKFCRYEEAIAFLDETPSHLIWADSQVHELCSKNYREKLEFKLKRAGKSGIAKE